MTIEDYETYFEQFNPVKFNADDWMKEAKNAGMKYVVFTAKHHDGFCLYDSKYSDYKITNTQFKRDVLKDVVEAARKYDLKVGVYFSIIDWHHPDFPKYDDLHHPLRGNEAVKNETIDFDRYLDFMHKQVEEIVSGYGKIDIMWFDFSYEDMSGDTWKAEELMEMVRSYQPHVIIDNRLEASGEAFGTMVEEHPKSYAGDFFGPEMIVPPKPIYNVKGELVPWELCTTLNNNWGYSPYDTDYKSAKFLIRKIVECVSKGGNFLLNVAPTALGEFNKESIEILREMGEWFESYGESIYENGIAAIEKPDWGYYTQKDNIIYAHIFDGPLGVLPLTGIKREDIAYVTRVSDSSEVVISDNWTALAFPEYTFVELYEDHATKKLENDIDTVLKIVLK